MQIELSIYELKLVTVGLDHCMKVIEQAKASSELMIKLSLLQIKLCDAGIAEADRLKEKENKNV